MQVVKLRRRPGFHAIYIGRGSVYGNPFTHLPLAHTRAAVQVATREEAVAEYEHWLRGDPRWAHIEPERRLRILRELPLLPEDAVLACFCKPHPCHGDVLVTLYYELRAAA
jgi:hypothetical protein